MFGSKKSRVQSPESRVKSLEPGDSRLSTHNARLSPLAPGPRPLAPGPWPLAPGPSRRAITLVELLVVITILTLLSAIMLPRMRPMMENRRVREAARGLHVFLTQARIRAMETGRPCGVLFQRANDRNQPNACVVMRQVEIPEPYAGDVEEAVVIAQDWTLNPNTGAYHWPGYYVLKVAIRADNQWSDGLVRYGDRMQLNYQGPFYEIFPDPNDTPDKDFPVDTDGFIQFSAGVPTPPPPTGDAWADNYVLTLRLPVADAPPSPWPPVPPPPGYPEVTVGATVATNWSREVPFKIYRQPTAGDAFGSIAPSFQLPRGVAVDLNHAGYSGGNLYTVSDPSPATPPNNPPPSYDRFAALYVNASNPPGGFDTRPVIVMFSPNGSLTAAYHSYYTNDDPINNPVAQYGGNVLTAPVFLLVGRWDRVLETLPDDGLSNWQDLTNFWLAINPQTGLVTVAEPGAVADPTVPDAVSLSRALAREAQISKGGR